MLLIDFYVILCRVLNYISQILSNRLILLELINCNTK
jgi:hypothetical protein